MSVQQGQSAPRAKTSPKQGPLRATMPISSVTKEGSLLRAASPAESPPRTQDPHWGRRSPGAAPYKGGGSENTKTSSKDIPTMRRTASLDTIYLRGLFPREGVFWHRDRATQTDISTISNSLDSLQALASTEIVEDKLARLSVRQRRRSCSRDSNDQSDQTATASSQTRNSSSSPRSPSQNAPPKSSRSSEEGLNQEIESYILKSEQELKLENERLKEPTPEGRKAPVADLLREPAYARPFPQCNQNSSEDSQGSSPDQDQERTVSGSSPHINRFSSRAPPDGCERVLSKSVPLLRPIPLEVKRPHPDVVFTLKPSSHSAFETLQKDLKVFADDSSSGEEKGGGGNGKKRDSPIVPDQ